MDSTELLDIMRTIRDPRIPEHKVNTAIINLLNEFKKIIYARVRAVLITYPQLAETERELAVHVGEAAVVDLAKKWPLPNKTEDVDEKLYSQFQYKINIVITNKVKDAVHQAVGFMRSKNTVKIDQKIEEFVKDFREKYKKNPTENQIAEAVGKTERQIKNYIERSRIFSDGAKPTLFDDTITKDQSDFDSINDFASGKSHLALPELKTLNREQVKVLSKAIPRCLEKTKSYIMHSSGIMHDIILPKYDEIMLAMIKEGGDVNQSQLLRDFNLIKPDDVQSQKNAVIQALHRTWEYFLKMMRGDSDLLNYVKASRGMMQKQARIIKQHAETTYQTYFSPLAKTYRIASFLEH